MKITDIIKESEELNCSWLLAGFWEDAKNCGCKKCRTLTQMKEVRI